MVFYISLKLNFLCLSSNAKADSCRKIKGALFCGDSRVNTQLANGPNY